MNSTYTQAQAEDQVLAALATITGQTYRWDMVSDAVDVYLSRNERESGRLLDRGSIPREVVFDVLDTIVRDARADA